MASSFNGVDLFGPGPHRFSQGAQGNLVVPVSVYSGVFLPGSITYGMIDLDVIVTGRLVADSEAALWTKRNAITAILQFPPIAATLIDHHAHSWTNMSFYKFEEGNRTDRARKASLAFTAHFRKALYNTAGDG